MIRIERLEKRKKDGCVWYRRCRRVEHHPTAPAVAWDDGDRAHYNEGASHNTDGSALYLRSLREVQWCLQSTWLLHIKDW